ncbi:MAG: RdgB/HAM1 family non-canonical purine NTP pyrophosphatase [Chromatiales bacterium]|jgi:XTP/dITP diphosphohydrolase|nr:RdgB/HAM1 family non-canonical purine NTP pyrophosphatase [Chromatiales bacterium]
MAMPRKLVLASNNPGKLREFQQLLGAPWQLLAQSALGVEPIAETGSTFRENALQKARHASAATGLPALADDSGIEVDALDGAPGVWSARYAGPDASDAANNAKLLAELAGVPPARRTARFRCCLVFVRDAHDAAPLIAEGVWEGRVAMQCEGGGGFGYDPLFIDIESGSCVARLDPAEKNRYSHRQVALQSLLTLLAGAD